MTEYWVNVYKYSGWDKYLYSHKIRDKNYAIRLGSDEYATFLAKHLGTIPRKCIYRIHIKMKELW